LGGGGNDAVKNTNTNEIQILFAGYHKPAKLGKYYLFKWRWRGWGCSEYWERGRVRWNDEGREEAAWKKIGEKVEELAEMVREGKRQLGIVRNEQRYLRTTREEG
jgi:hypothetical protein